jgi:hypothetical protein
VNIVQPVSVAAPAELAVVFMRACRLAGACVDACGMLEGDDE